MNVVVQVIMGGDSVYQSVREYHFTNVESISFLNDYCTVEGLLNGGVKTTAHFPRQRAVVLVT